MNDETIKAMITVHHRKPGTYRALCGDGYDWPSTIMFATEETPATCSRCIRALNREESTHE